MTFCPDCQNEIPEDAFVAHREAEHPPATKTVVIPGIESEEVVHGERADR